MAVTQPVNRVRTLLASVNCDGAWGAALLATCLLLLLPELGGDAARMALRYERAGIASGQWWRLVTGHWIHLDVEHATLNCLGLVLMWALFARDYRPRQWTLIILASVAAIDCGLWLRDSTVAWYVGSSGVLHGLMVAGTLAHVRRRDLDGWLLAVFIIVKLIYEQTAGALPFAGGHVGVVVNAHLYGSMGGAAMAVCLKPRPEPV